MKQFIVNRHTTPATPALEEVPNEKIRVFKNEATIDAALSSLDENEIVATEDGAESSTRIGNPLGTILAIYSNAVPYGYLPCNGVAFDENQYPALYAMLGTNKTPDTPCDLGADWDNAESITLSTSDYVAQENGWIVGYGVTSVDGDVYLAVNDILVSRGGCWVGNYTDRCVVQIKVNKGDVVKSSSNFNAQDFHFVPFKKYAHFVIKATSGLEETQQDYVLQSLLEADSYSTDEVATGKKWIDGKTIYRKVFYSATNWSNGATVGTIDNFDMIINITDIAATASSGGSYHSNYGTDGSNAEYAYVERNSGQVKAVRASGFANSLPSTIIVEYTKN